MGTLFNYLNPKILIIIFLPVLIISCEGTLNPKDVADSFYDIPVITGLIITTPDSPEPIAVWRNPQTQSSVHYETNQQGGIGIGPMEMNLETPYPNPTDGSISIKFSLPISTQVKIWVVKGRLPEEKVKGNQNISGGTFFSSRSTINIELMNENKNAGVYQIDWDGKDKGGKNAPSGFYRVYFEADDHLFWKDILLARNINELPPDLRR